MDTTSLARDLELVQAAKIFFGHQSVGRDVLDGVRLLAEKAGTEDVRILVLDQDSLLGTDLGALYHERVGENRNPRAKCEAFEEIIRAHSNTFDIAILKLCYVDVVDGGREGFTPERYLEVARFVKKESPATAFIPATVPLRARSQPYEGLGSRVKHAIKRGLNILDQNDRDNVARQQFNEQIRKNAGNAHVFDIAAIESTYPDGNRVESKAGGKSFYSLADELTHDGGHLNELGKRVVAREFIRVLAKTLRDRSPASPPRQLGL
jgi:hypothetical protein